MKNTILFLLISSFAFAQKKASIIEESRTFQTYLFSDPNPNPILSSRKNIYPYHSFEGYSLIPESKKWKVIKLENDYIIVWVLPEVGGKVWGAVEKSTGKEFIYRNEVMKFRNISMRGPWTSGGIEFNFGFIGHNPSTATPVDYLARENPDGSVSCFVGNADLTSRTQWRVEIRLPKDKAYFETIALWNNPSPLPQTYYNFMTAAAAVSEDLEFFYPGNKTLDHNGSVHPWPKDEENHDLSLYKNDNFGADKSIHSVGENQDFMGGYFHKSNFGFGHWALNEDMPGRKLWLWSTARDGGIWEDLLTDKDGQYMEFQAGRSFNQYAQSPFRSPIKELPFNPSVTDIWKELWFPVKEIGGLTEVSPKGILNVKNKKGKLEIGVNALAFVNSKIVVRANGKILFSFDKIFKPMDVFKTSVDLKGNNNYEVIAEGMDLNHTSENPNLIKRPFVTNIQVKTESAANFYQIGIEQKENRAYAESMKSIKECLRIDPVHIDALATMAELLFRKNLQDSALIYINQALQLDTYHPAANYFAGINYLAKKDYTNAMDAFGWAARAMEFRSVSNAEMAGIKFIQNEFELAEQYGHQSLDFNRFNSNAMQVLALVYRKTGKKEKALEILTQILEIDPLNHFASFEKYNLNKSAENLQRFLKKINNEFPYQTFLELSLVYYKLGLETEAFAALEKAPKHVMVSVWKAYLNKNELELTQAANESPAFVFPYRIEDVEALNWAISKNANWKFKYYLALNYWGIDRNVEAKALLSSLGNEPDYSPFYISRASFFNGVDENQVLQDLTKAKEINPKDWRNWNKLIEYYNIIADHETELSLTSEAKDLFQGNFYIALQHAKALLKNKKYDVSLGILSKMVAIPFEQSTEGKVIYEQAYILKALELISNQKYETANAALEKSKEYPENLGVGKPYEPDNRIQDYLQAYIMNKTGKATLANGLLEKVKTLSQTQLSKNNLSLNNMLYFSLLQKDGDAQKISQILQQIKTAELEKLPVSKWIMAIVEKDNNSMQKLEKEFSQNVYFNILKKAVALN
jgi:Tfp pilus assembly protein PilF